MINRFAHIKYYLKLLISELLSDPQDVVALFIWVNITASGIAAASAVMTNLATYSWFIVEVMINDDLSTVFLIKRQHKHAPRDPV